MDESDLIAAIYDTAINPSGWDEVLKRIVAATNSTSGALIFHHADATHFTALCNIDPFYANAYVQTYSKISPLAAEAATIAPGEVRAGTYITQTDGFRASAFYNEFARPQGWADVVRIGLLCAPSAAGRLVLHRSPNAICVEPAEWHFLENLAPHLKRAAAIKELLSRAGVAMETLGVAVAAAGFAVFLLTKDCRVVFANAKAEEILRRKIGLRLEHGRLAAAMPALTERLHALARDGARAGQGEGCAGGTLELGRGENCLPIFVHVFPLAANRAASIFDIERPAAAAFVVDEAAKLGAQIRRFAVRYDLTDAETRVLAEIISGNGLVPAAARLRVTRATARTHAARIFAKTGTKRQTELIRRFFETTTPNLPTRA